MDAAGHVALILGILGIANDITERKAVELALRESERKLRLLMDGKTDRFRSPATDTRPNACQRAQ